MERARLVSVILAVIGLTFAALGVALPPTPVTWGVLNYESQTGAQKTEFGLFRITSSPRYFVVVGALLLGVAAWLALRRRKAPA